MRTAAHRIAVSLLAVLVAALGAIGIAGVVARWSWPGPLLTTFAGPELAIGLSWAPVGLVLVGRRPRNALGWVVLLAGISPLADRAAGALVELGGGPIAARVLVDAVHLLPLLPFPVLPALALVLFPDGRPPSRRWWWFLAPLLVAGFVASAGTRYAPGTPFFSGSLWEVVAGSGGLLLPAAVTALVVRRRRADPVLRQQVRGVMFAMAVAVAVMLTFVVIHRPWLGNSALAIVPVSIIAAVARYRLFDLDRLISRTVSYTLVVVVLAAVYVGGVAAVGSVASALSEGSGDLAVALSTLTVAALFQPLRRRVRSLVDRRFDRARYDASRVVDAFGRDLRDEVSLGTVVDRLGEVARRSVRPSHVSVVLVPGGDR